MGSSSNLQNRCPLVQRVLGQSPTKKPPDRAQCSRLSFQQKRRISDIRVIGTCWRSIRYEVRIVLTNDHALKLREKFKLAVGACQVLKGPTGGLAAFETDG